MLCPNCNLANHKTADYCKGCGLFFCEKNYKNNDRWFLEEERRYVTVLFSDLTGYSKLFELKDPEKIKEMTQKIFGEVSLIVSKYHGVIERVIGDEVMVLFGVPKIREDDCARAVRAAMEIHTAVKALGTEFDGNPEALTMHSGINTGLVVTGKTDSKKAQDGFTGQAIHLAAHLAKRARPDQIIVGHETFRRTRYGFNYRELKPFFLEGRAEPVPIYELLSKKENVYRPRIGSERIVHSDFVGREDELRILEGLVIKALHGEGSIVNLIGEAGIGKSRLIFELKKIDAIKSAVILEGKSVPIGWNLSFHPIVDLLRNWAGIKESDSGINAFVKLETAIKNANPENVNEVIPFIAALMGIRSQGQYEKRIEDIEGAALERLIQKNLRALLVRATEISPLVIILEDLHWADVSSLDLLEAQFRLVTARPILLINVFRAHYGETVDRVVSTLRKKYSNYYTELNLPPLDEPTGTKLISNLLHIDKFSHHTTDQILQIACGNPFFIEEVVRTLIDSGALVLNRGHYEITAKLDTFVVPQLISDVLLSRIDMLDESAGNLLRVASVAGRSFLHRILFEVMGPGTDLTGVIEQLKEIELIVEHETMGERKYHFRHALAQEAVYNSILLQKRKGLHLRVAKAIENVFRDRLNDFYGMLAYHYSSGDDPDNSEKYMIKAGEESLKASAWNEALYFYRKALDLYLQRQGEDPDPNKTAELKRNIALALFYKAQYIEAVNQFDEVLAYYGEKTPARPASRALKFCGSFFMFLVSIYFPFLRWRRRPSRRDNEIIDLFFKKITALSSTDSQRFFLETFYLTKFFTKFDLSLVPYGPGIFVGGSITMSLSGISFRLSRKILAFVEMKLDPRDKRSLLAFRVAELMHNFLGGKLYEENYDPGLVEDNLKIGEVHFVTGYFLYLGLTYTELGCYGLCQETVDRLFQIEKNYNNIYAMIQKYRLKAKLLLKFRKLDEAVLECNSGIDRCIGKDYKPILFLFHSYKSKILSLCGDIEGAENSLQNAREIKGDVHVIPLYLSDFLISEFMLCLYYLEKSTKIGDKRQLYLHRRRAQETAKKMIKIGRKVASSQAEILKLMGVYCWLLGDQNKALRWWSKSIAWCELFGGRLDLPRIYMEIGRRLSEPQSKYKQFQGQGSQEFLRDAQYMFAELGLQWDLDQIQKLTAGPILLK